MHQHGIPFENLPKTFQDTVEFAQGIGIKYVWIDSLCIIQGNSQDWHLEAVKIRDVYWIVAFVVAASGAKDSSEGLFVSERPILAILRLPYRVTRECEGTFNMGKLPKKRKDSDCNPAAGPLDRRAWTLKERYLAQRLITFMPHCISWTCNMAAAAETGETLAVFHWVEKWTDLLEEYTTRSLTFASGRIEALRGIGQLYQGYRKDPYIADYGTWEEELVFQLLWFNRGSSFKDGSLTTMPSWSWAATESAKRWLPEGDNFVWNSILQAEEMPERLFITPAGHLQVSGHLSTIKVAPSCVPDEFTARDLELNGLQTFLYLWEEWKRNGPGVHILTQDIDGTRGYEKAVIGIARFDNDATTTYTHTHFLAKQKNKSEEWYPLWKPFVKKEFIVRVHHASKYRALRLTPTRMT